jgi:hypothetical protein
MGFEDPLATATVQTPVCWPLLVLFKTARLVRVANLWKPPDAVQTELCTVTWQMYS